MEYQYKSLEDIRKMVKSKKNVTVMGERRWSAKRAGYVIENLAGKSSTDVSVQAAGFFRAEYGDSIDLTDAARLIFFTEDWQIQCIFNNTEQKYAVYECSGGAIDKSYKTIRKEKAPTAQNKEGRYAYAVRLGVMDRIPEQEQFIINEDDATWRIKP
jgi:hypothetical protein